MIHLVDYSAGNIHSVARAFKHHGKDVVVSKNLDNLKSDDLLVLPGVGAFGYAVKSLEEEGLFRVIKERVLEGQPFLGICLGLQLLMGASEETPNIKGLDVVAGEVKKFSADIGLTIPQIGWNNVAINNKFFKDFDNKYFYFVHSYYVEVVDSDYILARSEYGQEYTSGIIKDNIIAVQFHPEKSGETGLSFLAKVMQYFKM